MDIIDDLSEVLSGLSSADSTPVKATKASKRSKANFKPKNLFTDDEDDDAFIYQEGSCSYLNQAAVDRLETLHADKVPDAPNGPVKYRVKYVEREPLSAVADNWRWGRSQHVPSNDFCKEGRRTLQYCNGSYECQNDSCPYKIQCESNKVDFRKGNKCILNALQEST